MPKNGVAPILAKIVGLPGFTAMPWKTISPRAAITSSMQSRSPTELPPENTMMSCARAASSAIDERVDRVAGRAHRDGTPAVAADDRLEREAVDVVDLSGRERPARRDDLVAGREDGDRRLREHLDRRRADGGERADPARRQHLTGRNHDVADREILAARRPTFWRGPTARAR